MVVVPVTDKHKLFDIFFYFYDLNDIGFFNLIGVLNDIGSN